MSLLLKTFSFLAFQIYHTIHGKVAITSELTPPFFARDRRKSMFAYSDVHGKAPGEVVMGDKAQHCNTGGHSKTVWFIVSRSAPQRIQVDSLEQCLPWS